MKKSLILAGMLAIGYANAQTGKVGINTQNPKATLEVVPSATNSANTATTNEGIVAPKLSKARIANIVDANLVEGTLVYATDATYTGNNAKVAKITEKGYYFYNGTEWVKTSAGDANTSIYTNDGAFTSDRLATMNEKNLTFMGRNDHNVMISKDGRIKIGTGTTMPGSALTIDGTGGANDDIAINTYNNSPNNNSAFSFYSNRYNGTIENKQPVVAGNYLANFNFRAYNGTALVNGAVINAIVSEVDGTNVKTNLILSPTKNVGIGTNDPQAKLDVNGNMRVTTPGGQWITSKTGTGGITSSTKLTTSYHPFLRQETVSGHFANIGGIGDNFGIYAITKEQTANATTGQLVMNTATGNVAIGQTNPDANAKLTVNGNTKITGLAGTGDRPVAVAADGTLKVGAALQNLQGSTSVAITNNQIQRAALTGDVTAAANSNATTISNNAVTTAKIANNAVTTAKIANGTILAEDLNQMGATNGQVLKWNGTAWAPAADGNTTYTGSTSVVLSGTSFQRAALTGDVTAAANSNATTISNNAVTTAKIANNAVTSAKIANGTILAEDLNQMGATNGQVLKWNGTAWAPAADSNTTYTAGQAIDITSNKISVKTPVRTVSGAYTLAVADDNGYVYVNSASAVNVTIPSSLPAGFSCIVIQQGAGQVTIVGNGVTVRTARGTKTRTQYSAVGIIKRATNEATITGDAIN